MKPRSLILPIIGAGLSVGCASPFDERWDNPVYRSLQTKYTQHDQQPNPAETQTNPITKDLETQSSLEINDAIRIAIENHPKLRAAGYRIDAATGIVLQSGLHPNPSLNMESEALGSNAGRGGETAFTIEQQILLGNQLNNAKDVARSDKLSTQIEFEALEFAIATQVSNAYFSVLSAQQRLQRNQELVALSTQLLDSVNARFDAGSATETDRLRAEVVYEQALLSHDATRFQLDAANQSLASALGTDSKIDTPLITEIDQLPVLPTHNQLIASTLEANSKVSLAKLAIERAKQSHKLAQSQASPDLFVSVGPRYSDIDNETTLDLGLSLEIPLFDRNQGEIQATLSQRLSASAQLREVQLELLAEVSNAWSNYQSSLSAANRYRDQLIPKSERTLELTKLAYESGKTDFLRLLDAQQVLIESRLSYLTTLEQLHHSAALLNELSHSSPHWRNPTPTPQIQSTDHTQTEASR